MGDFDFIQSFKQISSAEWAEILILLCVATILGFIIGWLLRSFRVNKLRRLLSEKNTQYTTLNKTYTEKMGFMNEMEAENSEMTNRITILNNEIKSLKLKLTNNNGASTLLVNAEEDTALITIEDKEISDNEEGGKLGWMQRLRNAFNTNEKIAVDGNEVSVEEKLTASNNMIERLLSSNEKLEDDNERLKQNIINLEATVSEEKTTTFVPTPEPKIVKQELDVEKIDKYTNSLKDAKTTSTDLLKRIEELEIYNGKIIKLLEAETKEKVASQQKLISDGDYKEKYLELAPKFETVEIDNNKLKAELSKAKSNAEIDTAKAELKVKQEELEKSNSEKQALTLKLQDTAKALVNCNDQQKVLKTKLEESVSKSKITAPVTAAISAPPPIKTPPAAVKKSEPENKTVLETSHDIMARIKNKATSIDFGRIGLGNAAKKDDLKKVKGIGEFVEKKLNALGIYNFGQLAKLTENDMDKVNDAIEFFPGRIKRDNWVDQAKKLAADNN